MDFTVTPLKWLWIHSPILGVMLGGLRFFWNVAVAVSRTVKTLERLTVRIENHMAHDEIALKAIDERLATQDKALTILLERTKNL